MKKLFILILLVLTACGGGETVEESTQTIADTTVTSTNVTTSSTTTTTSSTTTTTYNMELAWDNFLLAWENNLKAELILTSSELEMTEELEKIWVWQGDKYNLDQYLFEIEVNGLICTRIYNSMGWALLDEIHPIEKDYRSSHTYKCDESGSLYLFGDPFYYQDNWWIYHNIELDWSILDCDDPCGSRAQNYASKFKIDNPQDLLNNQYSTTTSTTPDTTTTTSSTTTTTTTVVTVDYPQLVISEISSSIPEYNRDDWNHWIDENGDCQNTRHEVLIEESFETVTYTSDTYCSVSTGKWYGNYTGQYYYNASELDIDHFIPLKNAHQSGGYNWSSAKKEEFANYRLDPDNLIAVNLSANRSKGAKGPDEWKPSNTEYWCEYAYDWIRIKDYWNLTATQAEWDALVSMIETCPAGFAYADAEEEPVAELPTPTTTTTSSTTTTTTTVVSSQPDNPGDSKNCGDFANYAEAKAWFDKYEPYYGDVARLDRDGDLIPCESLSGAP